MITGKNNASLDIEYRGSVFQPPVPAVGIQSRPNQEEGSEAGCVDWDNDEMNDVRKLLFSEIPEPYPHSTGFQRVVITTDDSQVDDDTLYACKKLKECIFLRNKWLGQHPTPPQDSMFYSTVVTSPLSSPSKSGGKKCEFRRRVAPVYDIFDQPLRSTEANLQYRLVRGVMIVTSNVLDGDERGLSQASSDDLTYLSHEPSSSSIKYHCEKSLYTVFSFHEFVKDYRRVIIT